MRALSLRSRLVLALLVVAAAGLVAADVATYTSLRSFLFDQTDQTLESEHHFADQGGRGPGRLPPDLYVEIRSLSGALLYSQGPGTFPGGKAKSLRLPSTASTRPSTASS